MEKPLIKNSVAHSLKQFWIFIQFRVGSWRLTQIIALATVFTWLTYLHILLILFHIILFNTIVTHKEIRGELLTGIIARNRVNAIDVGWKKWLCFAMYLAVILRYPIFHPADISPMLMVANSCYIDRRSIENAPKSVLYCVCMLFIIFTSCMHIILTIPSNYFFFLLYHELGPKVPFALCQLCSAPLPHKFLSHSIVSQFENQAPPMWCKIYKLAIIYLTVWNGIRRRGRDVSSVIVRNIFDMLRKRYFRLI